MVNVWLLNFDFCKLFQSLAKVELILRIWTFWFHITYCKYLDKLLNFHSVFSKAKSWVLCQGMAQKWSHCLMNPSCCDPRVSWITCCCCWANSITKSWWIKMVILLMLRCSTFSCKMCRIVGFLSSNWLDFGQYQRVKLANCNKLSSWNFDHIEK